MITINAVIQKAKTYLPELHEGRVRRAFDFAETAHRGQTRFSGEPYIVHPLNVAWLVLDFRPDEDTIIAALLHDVAEDTERSLEEIEREFGSDVRNLCWGLMKLSKVRSKLNDPQVENLRKLFFAMAKDFRVVLLKLCDRFHNMQTLQFVRPEKQTRIAQETLNIYAPIAARLGIYHLKSQMEDMCFQHLYPRDFADIQEQLKSTGKWRDRYILTAKKILVETLAAEGIQSQVDGRVKSAYSIYRKLKKKNKNSLEDIFDVFAMRIILPDIYKHDKEYTGHLYTALGVIHNHFTPLANRFKDYVAVPKVNGYRSLHTTVMGLGPKIHTQPTEIQFRTETMHQGAELGIAAHWMYEEGGRQMSVSGSLEAAVAGTVAPYIRKQKDWISDLHKVESEIQNNQEFLERLQEDLFQDRIFVLTPRGDVKDLPLGATPIDFAYAVHTEIGNHCIGAKVNGNIVPLDHELRSGEVVDVVIRKNASPSQHWLSFAKTNHARNRIRSWFRDLNEEKHLKAGRDILNKKLEQLGRPPLDVHLSILKIYGGKELSVEEREDVLRGLGQGTLFLGGVIRKIFTLDELLAKAPPVHASVSTERRTHQTSEHEKPLIIGGQPQVPYQFVQCCQATSDDELLGYITRGRGVSVHRRSCAVLKNTDQKRLVPVQPVGKPLRYPVNIHVEATDRLGLVRDMSQLIAENAINILNITQSCTDAGIALIDFILEIEEFDQLDRVLSKLEKIPNVSRACRVN